MAEGKEPLGYSVRIFRRESPNRVETSAIRRASLPLATEGGKGHPSGSIPSWGARGMSSRTEGRLSEIPERRRTGRYTRS